MIFMMRTMWAISAALYMALMAHTMLYALPAEKLVAGLGGGSPAQAAVGVALVLWGPPVGVYLLGAGVREVWRAW